MHAKRQAFITWSEVFRLKQKPGLDTNTPPQVNKDPVEGGGGEGVEERRCVVDTHTKKRTWTDSCSHSELRTEEWLLTQVQYLFRHMSL